MLFIKNCTNAEGHFGVQFHQDGDATVIGLVLPDGDVVSLLSSNAPVAASVKKSVEYIGKKTKTLNRSEDGKTIKADLLTDHATEVAFFVKNQKMKLTRVATEEEPLMGAPVTIEVVAEGEDTDENGNTRRFPRDIIVFICEKRSANAEAHYDARNVIGGPVDVIVADDEGVGYELLMLIPKWPTWSTLKFPAYICIGLTSEDGTFVPDASVKLGSRVEGGITKNQLDDADPQEAFDYLAESQKRLEERRMQNQINKINNKNHGEYNNRKGADKSMNKGKNPNGKSGSKNSGSNNKVGFPQMYPGKGGNGTKPAQNQNQKNYRKSGNR